MELPLVVGVDGSESSLRAVDWAAGEAALHGVPLRLVNASMWERYEGSALAQELGRPSEQVMAENIVGTAAERARRRDPDLKIQTDILPEDTVSALLSEGRNAFALVTGSRGRSGLAGMLLGSVGLAVAARADCPVFVIRGNHDPQSGTHRRIILGVDEPPEGSAAVRFAFREAERRRAALHAIRAWRCPAHEAADHPLLVGDAARYHESQAAEILEAALREAVADHPTLELHRATAEGPARVVLMNASATADLLVVGAQRRHGHFGLQLGRVAHAVLHHSVCPVAVVPQLV
ncbi:MULTISPECIES: universal stress protein [unclassified Streptomyces]|uniref:universal stress protein n=1 Tax=unclassified Streptomyces TaxID=2593676 RepID=UPI002DD7C105|nr:universal stress protein [Streptomyces sp. NBC_01750]WSB03680.1 universal stress protein [Streptomyces sp. NBC_01794]WSD32032.1 universal stress protein [Streptomyces sp. NBC_01750]